MDIQGNKINEVLLIGQIILNKGYITEQQLDQALKSKPDDVKTGEHLVSLGFINQKQLVECLGERYGVPYIDLDAVDIKYDAVSLLPEHLARKYEAFPLEQSLDTSKLKIVISNPMNLYAIEDIKFTTGCALELYIGEKDAIIKVLDAYYTQQTAMTAADEMNEEISREFEEEIAKKGEADESVVDSAPVVKLVNSIFSDAISTGASDIHIEAMKKCTRVRFRIDGLLSEKLTLDKKGHNALVTRIKILSGLNIAEKRVPQDGRFSMMVNGKKYDMRISILPTVMGEKVVGRVLGSDAAVALTIDKLGFVGNNLTRFKDMLKLPHGVILVTGPTGSGKSTTLYTALGDVNKPEINVVTVEDPVEFNIPDTNQVQINTKAGMTFPSALRSILRQDPDIIMIGEIRDGETADIAIRAAITGHLVLSTIHTNDAASTISRLVDMGVKPFMVSAAVSGIMAQRLVRRICPACKKEYITSKYEMEVLKLDKPAKIYKGEGCPVCNFLGYKGRAAIHEVLIIDNPMRDMITTGATSQEIKDYAIKEGMVTLFESAKYRVLDGTTTVDELIRVAFEAE